MFRRAHLLACLASLLFVTLVVAAGCGRSDLGNIPPGEGGSDSGTDGNTDGNGDADGGDATDGPVEGGGCNPLTCPNGCCDANNVCQSGTTVNACGTQGASCEDCIANGFNTCD